MQKTNKCCCQYWKSKKSCSFGQLFCTSVLLPRIFSDNRRNNFLRLPVTFSIDLHLLVREYFYSTIWLQYSTFELGWHEANISINKQIIISPFSSVQNIDLNISIGPYYVMFCRYFYWDNRLNHPEHYLTWTT